jgi:endo-1,4-beta-xylanase
MVALSTLFLNLVAVTASFAAPVADPDLPPHVERRGPNNFVLTADHPLMVARRNASLEARTNYVQDYTTGGTVNFAHSGNSFSLNFNTKEDFVVGIGWNPGSTAYDNPSVLFPLPLTNYPIVPSPTVARSALLAVSLPCLSTAGQPTP